MSNVRLSVIIAYYKPPKAWIQRCVSSILRATSENDEVIIVNDGDDEAIPFLDEFVKQSPRLRVFHTPNQGQTGARNFGMNEARGEFITFADDDDEVYPSIYEKTLEALRCTNNDIAVCGVRTVWPDASMMRDNSIPDQDMGVLTPTGLQTLYKATLFNYPWNKVYRADFLKKHNIRFELKSVQSEDFLFNMECVMAQARWSVINEIGYIYYRPDTSSLRHYQKYNKDRLLFVADAWKRYCATSTEADALFKKYYVDSDAALAWMQWENIWKLYSPYSFSGKYQYLKENRSLLGRTGGGWQRPLLNLSPLALLLSRAVYQFFRRYFYIRPIRRWHILRHYPYAVPIATER